MPELRTEQVYEDGELQQKKVMVLPNGAKLILLRHNREMQGVYVYRDAKFEFWLMASRWNEDITLADTWTVYLESGLARMSPPQRDELTPNEIARIRTNIETALRAWPPGKVEAEVPIQQFRFE